MIEKILSALRKNNVEEYFITENKSSSAQLFFVKKRLDLVRRADITEYNVNVYRNFTLDGKDCTGSSEIKIEEKDSDDEIEEKIRSGYEACNYVKNPAYAFEPGVKAKIESPKDGYLGKTLEQTAMELAGALYKYDVQGDPLINSAEIFVNREDKHIIGSNGCDVSFSTCTANGEYVAQCKIKEDVEMHHQFDYDLKKLEPSELSEKVQESLETVKSRSVAEKTTPKGNWDVILSDKSVETILQYYSDRASAYMIYPGYSTFKKETDVMGENVTGDRLTMKLIAREPFSIEGIPMEDRVLLDKGVLKTVQGHTRLCSYLKEKPTGQYSAMAAECGDMSYDSMKSGKVLHLVSFSDFQMDEMSGYFGGEIRLAYLYEDGKMTPVTGGSVNGNLIELQKNMKLSSERQKTSTFDGPKYIMFHGVPVNGV